MSKIERMIPEKLEKLRNKALVPKIGPEDFVRLQSRFDDVDQGRAKVSYPDTYKGTWESWKAEMYEKYRQMQKTYEESERLRKLEFVDCVRQLSGVKLGHPADFRDISAVEHSLHIQLAEDFKTYLSYCGEITMFDSESIGFVGIGTENDICEAMQICREEFPYIPKDMYPVCGLDSEKIAIMMYLQDANGYVYFLDEKDNIVPAFVSLQDLIIRSYYRVKGGKL